MCFHVNDKSKKSSFNNTCSCFNHVRGKKAKKDSMGRSTLNIYFQERGRVRFQLITALCTGGGRVLKGTASSRL